MPNPQVTRKDIATRAVTPQRRVFDKITGAMREARVFFVFQTADRAVSMPHSLGRTPTQWRVVSLSKDNSGAGTAPGVVYTPVVGDAATSSSETGDQYNLTRTHIVLACTTANTWAEVIVS